MNRNFIIAVSFVMLLIVGVIMALVPTSEGSRALGAGFEYDDSIVATFYTKPSETTVSRAHIDDGIAIGFGNESNPYSDTIDAVSIRWGDDSTIEEYGYDEVWAFHNYTVAGVYTVRYTVFLNTLEKYSYEDNTVVVYDREVTINVTFGNVSNYWPDWVDRSRCYIDIINIENSDKAMATSDFRADINPGVPGVQVTEILVFNGTNIVTGYAQSYGNVEYTPKPGSGGASQTKRQGICQQRLLPG